MAGKSKERSNAIHAAQRKTTLLIYGLTSNWKYATCLWYKETRLVTEKPIFHFSWWLPCGQRK